MDSVKLANSENETRRKTRKNPVKPDRNLIYEGPLKKKNTT